MTVTGHIKTLCIMSGLDSGSDPASMSEVRLLGSSAPIPPLPAVRVGMPELPTGSGNHIPVKEQDGCSWWASPAGFISQGHLPTLDSTALAENPGEHSLLSLILLKPSRRVESSSPPHGQG